MVDNFCECIKALCCLHLCLRANKSRPNHRQDMRVCAATMIPKDFRVGYSKFE